MGERTMLHHHRCGFAGVALALGVAAGSGCQHSLPGTGLPGAPTTARAAAAPAKLDPRQVADVQMALGRSFEKRGDLAQAAAAYQEALKQDPSRADACTRLAVLHAGQGRFDQATELFKKALAAQPGSADLYCDMGYTLYL